MDCRVLAVCLSDTGRGMHFKYPLSLPGAHVGIVTETSLSMNARTKFKEPTTYYSKSPLYNSTEKLNGYYSMYEPLSNMPLYDRSALNSC